MSLVDTHCHIHSEDYPLAAEEAWQRANEAGVDRLLCVGTSVADSKQAITFAAAHANCWATVGLHPHDAKEGESALRALADICNHPSGVKRQKIVAIGECGLDYFYGHSSKKEQEYALRSQIELALAHDLPLCFHVREAFADFWPIFDSYRGVRGVLHSFTDSQENMSKALERNLFIGVNGIATFTKNDWQLEMYQHIPLSALLFETDAPFLTPKPYRGKINEPSRVKIVCDFLATLRGEPGEKLADASTQNAVHLFGLS